MHGRVIKLNIGADVEVVHAGSVGGQLTNGGGIDGSLVLVPLLGLGLGRGVVLVGALGELGYLLDVLDRGMLRDSGGAVHSIGVVGQGVRGVRGKAAAHGRPLVGDGRAAAASGDGSGHVDALAVALATEHLEEGMDIGVQGGDARVALIDDVEGLLQGLGVLLGRVSTHTLHVVPMHMPVDLGERSSAVLDMVALDYGLAGNDGSNGPRHGGLAKGWGILAHVGFGGAIVHGLVAEEATLVRTALVLDHGCLAAKGLEASIMRAFIGALAGVNAAMTCQGRGLNCS